MPEELHYCMCLRLLYAQIALCLKTPCAEISLGPRIALLHMPKNCIVPEDCMSISINKCSNYRYTVYTHYLYSESVIVQRRQFSWPPDIMSWPQDLLYSYHVRSYHGLKESSFMTYRHPIMA